MRQAPGTPKPGGQGPHTFPCEPYREPKDPRDLKILDPACGSGHFLLYAFDLLETIYEEAWGGEGQPESEATGRSLREDYPSIEGLRAAVPELILRYNLHSIDIDPRAVQIAGLALWLRAQRAWQQQRLPPAERPRITRSHLVCAEPMPGDEDLLSEFFQTIDPRLRPLVQKIWRELQLVGEAGSLLKIEEAIGAELDRARRDALATPMVQPRGVQADMFRGVPAFQPALTMPAESAEREFWDRAEEQVRKALEEYARLASSGKGTKRRLFSHDAEQGIAFVHVARERYDVALMNPPFGAATGGSQGYLNRDYPRTKNDLYAAFVERGLEWLRPGGRLGAITSRTGFFLSSFQKWREEILLGEAQVTVFADLGYGVLDSAMVETAAYCLEKSDRGA